MLIRFGRRDHKGPLFRLPCKALDADVRMAYMDHIESIGFAPAVCRGGGTCLHDERGVPADFITRGGVSCMTYVQVPGEKKVRSVAREHFHRNPRASDNFLILVAVG